MYTDNKKQKKWSTDVKAQNDTEYACGNVGRSAVCTVIIIVLGEQYKLQYLNSRPIFTLFVEHHVACVNTVTEPIDERINLITGRRMCTTSFYEPVPFFTFFYRPLTHFYFETDHNSAVTSLAVRGNLKLVENRNDIHCAGR